MQKKNHACVYNYGYVRGQAFELCHTLRTSGTITSTPGFLPMFSITYSPLKHLVSCRHGPHPLQRRCEYSGHVIRVQEENRLWIKQNQEDNYRKMVLFHRI